MIMKALMWGVVPHKYEGFDVGRGTTHLYGLELGWRYHLIYVLDNGDCTIIWGYPRQWELYYCPWGLCIVINYLWLDKLKWCKDWTLSHVWGIDVG